MTERLIEADDGVRLWTETVGERSPAVVCCHGGPGMADYLGPVADILAPRARTVRWDQRGSGRSDPEGPWSIERFVADLDCVRASCRDDAVVLLGHSWGANLALAYAQRHPSRVEALLYVSGTGLEWWPSFSRVHKHRQVERLGPNEGARLVELRARDCTPAEDRERRLLSIRSELGDVDDLHLAGRLLAHELTFPPNAAVNAALNAEARSLDTTTQRQACAAVACPVVIIHGGADPRPVDALSSMADALPNAELVVIDGVGHYPWLDDPKGFEALVARYVG